MSRIQYDLLLLCVSTQVFAELLPGKDPGVGIHCLSGICSSTL